MNHGKCSVKSLFASIKLQGFYIFLKKIWKECCVTEEFINIGVKLAKDMWNNLNNQLKPKSFGRWKIKMGTRFQKLIKLAKILNFILSS